jgi:hypothetical protein
MMKKDQGLVEFAVEFSVLMIVGLVTIALINLIFESKTRIGKIAQNTVWLLLGFLLILTGLEHIFGNVCAVWKDGETTISHEQTQLLGIMYSLGGGYILYWLLKKLFYKKNQNK